jgi:hypothetical protein
MNTGESEKGLKDIFDFTRLAAIIILLIHFYYYCYAAFRQWGLTAEVGDRFVANIYRTGVFKTIFHSKIMAVGLLTISLIGVRGRKSEKINKASISTYLVSGFVIYFLSHLLLKINMPVRELAITYMVVTTMGFVLILTGGTLLSRYIKIQFNKDIFNELNETFPQEERLIQNEYSINLPARYNLKGKLRKSWINIINPFRGVLVTGSPGSGKSYFVIQHVIKQHLAKGFSMLVYDFKYDDLSKIVYNTLLKHKSRYKTEPRFYLINFDDLSRSHRCNPLDASTMFDITPTPQNPHGPFC